MIYPIAPLSAINASNRHKVMPIEAIARVEFNKNQDNSYSKAHHNGTKAQNSRPIYNSQSVTPHFAIHILLEAGEIDNISEDYAKAAYNRKRNIPKTLLAVA